MTVLQVLMVVFGALVFWDLFRYARTGKARRHFLVFVRQPWFRWVGASLGGFAALTVVVLVATALTQLWPEGMGFTWLKLFATKEDGPVQGVNLYVAPARIPWVGLGFLALLLINVPRLARREEEAFRRGTRNWAHGAVRSLKFGLIHCLVGIPVAWGLALTVGGLWFTWHYFRGGVRRAWFYHVVYNFQLLILLGFWLIADQWAGR